MKEQEIKNHQNMVKTNKKSNSKNKTQNTTANQKSQTE